MALSRLSPSGEKVILIQGSKAIGAIHKMLQDDERNSYDEL